MLCDEATCQRDGQNENAAEAWPRRRFRSFNEEAFYFFLPAGFLAFALPADLATFAAFFFAAIVSTSPDSGMVKLLLRFFKL